MRTLIRILAPAALVLAATAAADAHAMLNGASPPVGSKVSPAPKEVVLTFTEKLEPSFSSIEVKDAKGKAVQAGKAHAGSSATQLRVALKPLPPGTYKVFWRVLSVDTHRTQGSFSFRVGP